MGAGPTKRTGPPKKSTQYLDTVVPCIVELLLCCVLILCIIGILGVTSLVNYQLVVVLSVVLSVSK